MFHLVNRSNTVKTKYFKTTISSNENKWVLLHYIMYITSLHDFYSKAINRVACKKIEKSLLLD